MKDIALTVSGKRYEINLEDDFADFVNKNLQESGINLNTDNTPDKLLKAYLKLAKQTNSYEDEVELLIKTFDNF
jgi:hypothetical protein